MPGTSRSRSSSCAWDGRPALGGGSRFPRARWIRPRSTDVGLRGDRRRILILVECWNTIGDLGAAARATSRKLAEVEALAIAQGGERPFTVRGVWVVRATARNRALVARYPEVFATRFPGSSARWVAALTIGSGTTHRARPRVVRRRRDPPLRLAAPLTPPPPLNAAAERRR